MRTIRRTISVAVMIAIAVAFMPVISGQAFAATKKPAAPKITSVKEVLSAYDDGPVVAFKWTKAKNAKKYEVAMRSVTKKWVKIKTVKKSAKNKKKYTKKNKYKVVAKGNKYKVYQYKYKYSIMESVKGTSYRLVDQTSYQYGKYYTDIELRPNATFVFSVRGVNGRKHSRWNTITFKISNDGYHYTTITDPGKKVNTTISGQDVTLAIGSESTLPVPGPNGKTVEAGPVTIVPEYMQYEYSIYKGRIMREDIYIRGITPDGMKARYNISLSKGVCEAVDYSISHPNFNNDGSKYSIKKCFVSGGGPSNYMAKDVNVYDPNVKVVWALDGTAPVLGQTDRWIKGNEYPFGQPPSRYNPYTGKLKVCGSASKDNTSIIWDEIKLYQGAFDYVEWIKVFNNTDLVEESFEGIYYDFDTMDDD